MGLYDTVDFYCPKCSSLISEQSKAGECSLDTYDSASVPTRIAGDLHDTEVKCYSCGITVRLITTVGPMVPMMAVKIKGK